MNEKFGVIANWLVLLACLISAAAATGRYMLNVGSNAWLEVQWYMFAGMVMLGAPYTLKLNEHVRVDLIYGSVSQRTRLWIDIVGVVLFLLPICIILIHFTWPWFVEFLAHSRDLVERGRARSLAGEAAAAGRICADGGAGRFGNHQADRGTCELPAGRVHLRKAAAMNFVRDNMAPLMFGGLILFMLIGYPAAFSLAAVGLFFGFIGIDLGLIAPDFLGNLTFQLFGIVSNELLLAIPFFTFMGAILERSGLAEDLLEGIGQLFGSVRGGLSYAVIVVGAILGAITGTVAATVIAMGVISACRSCCATATRHAHRDRRDRRLGHHRAAHSAVAGADRARRPDRPLGRRHVCRRDRPEPDPDRTVLLWVAIVSMIWPKEVPALPPEARTLHGAALWTKCLRGIMPSLGLIFLVLGTIFMGLATPTEAGAMGAIGALALAVFNRRFTWPMVYEAMSITMRITAMVIYILIGATVFSLVFQGVDGKEWIEHWLISLPGGQVGFLIFVNLVHFRARLLSRLLRDRLHRRAAAGTGRRQARHRPRLVRRAGLRQHADELHASAVRLRAVLSARHRAEGGQDRGHLLGRDSVACAAGHPGGDPDPLARRGDLLDRATEDVPPGSQMEIPLPDLLPPPDFGPPPAK